LERIRSIHRPEACATFYFHEKREEGYFSKKLNCYEFWRQEMVKECEKRPARPAKRRVLSARTRKKNFALVERGLTREEAIQEAQRCLALQGCESCEMCSLLCPDLCITRNEKTGAVEVDLDYCKGCGICAAVCPRRAIQMVWEEGA
jgi:2-oxoacid:acceptor oxidoreductase delta subunit (pyruvate/2-ketoisovalerate family)